MRNSKTLTQRILALYSWAQRIVARIHPPIAVGITKPSGTIELSWGNIDVYLYTRSRFSTNGRSRVLGTFRLARRLNAIKRQHGSSIGTYLAHRSGDKQAKFLNGYLGRRRITVVVHHRDGANATALYEVTQTLAEHLDHPDGFHVYENRISIDERYRAADPLALDDELLPLP